MDGWICIFVCLFTDGWMDGWIVCVCVFVCNFSCGGEMVARHAFGFGLVGLIENDGIIDWYGRQKNSNRSNNNQCEKKTIANNPIHTKMLQQCSDLVADILYS
jgi:hypothetical protein